MFDDIRTFVSLAAVGFSKGNGLGMGTSPIANCLDKYKQTTGGKVDCADGNSTTNFDTPPAGGWGYYDNGSFNKVQCKQKADGTTDVFCGKDGYF
jgi:hypothetical protein